MNKTTVILIIAFWVVVIGGFVAYKEFTLRTGTPVLLKTEPVDPRDMFRGDYIILNYDISRMDTAGIASGSSVYVGLVPEGDYHVASGIWTEQPEGLFIKGTLKDNGRIEYGIESFFIPEGTGNSITRTPDVKVAIDGRGNAVITALVVDGKEIGKEDFTKSQE
jgi:uncharacterized membrane-anchored protein